MSDIKLPRRITEPRVAALEKRVAALEADAARFWQWVAEHVTAEEFKLLRAPHVARYKPASEYPLHSASSKT